MKILVTAEDIENGRPEDPCLCPIGLALKRATGNTWLVGNSEVMLGVDKDVTFDLPPEAQDFVDRFDSGLIDATICPFEFEAAVPETGAEPRPDDQIPE